MCVTAPSLTSGTLVASLAILIGHHPGEHWIGHDVGHGSAQHVLAPVPAACGVRRVDPDVTEVGILDEDADRQRLQRLGEQPVGCCRVCLGQLGPGTLVVENQDGGKAGDQDEGFGQEPVGRTDRLETHGEWAAVAAGRQPRCKGRRQNQATQRGA
jgi:hypothetical protein